MLLWPSFGFLWGLLSDAHARCGIDMLDVHGEEHVATPRAHLGYQPDCMAVQHRERTAYMHMGTGELLTHESREVKFDPATGDEAEERYGLASSLTERFKAHREARTGMDRDEEFLKRSALTVEIGRAMLAKDGYHMTLAFLYALTVGTRTSSCMSRTSRRSTSRWTRWPTACD